MRTSADSLVVAPLYFPSRQPLSAFQWLLLPREWRLSQHVEFAELREDPLDFLNEVLAEYTASAGQSATGPSDANDGGASLTKSDLIEFAIQTWRLQRRVDGMDPEKMDTKTMDQKKHKKMYKQLSDSSRQFVRFLELFDIEFEDPTGKPYDSGWLEIEVECWDDPEDSVSPVDSGPWIKQTLKPIVRQSGVAISVGVVICVEDSI